MAVLKYRDKETGQWIAVAGGIGGGGASETSNSIIETNKGLEQKFWRGTQAEYDAIATKDESTMYIILDGKGGNTTGGSNGGNDIIEGGVPGSFSYGTTDLVEGVSNLSDGEIYFLV